TFAKMMRMTTKSRNVTKNMPTVSSAKDARYCNCARMRAAVMRRESAAPSRRSPTLHDQTAHAEVERPARRQPESDRPRYLRHERAHDRGAAHRADEDVDRCLHDRREWHRARDRREPAGEERHRDEEPREQVRDDGAEHP